MAANVPGIIWSALRALNLNEVVRDSPTRRDSSASSDSPYEPSLVDIALVKAMLIRAKQLPPDLVDAVLDMAEYWAHSATRLDERIGILGGNEERENRFLARILRFFDLPYPIQLPALVHLTICPFAVANRKSQLRSYPLGLVDAGVRQNANDQPYTTTLPTPRPLGKALDASFFAKSAKYPVPRLAHPARKVVFRIRSQDQGYVSNPEDAKEPYSKSWTWFDVGLERFDADGASEHFPQPPPSGVHLRIE